MMRAHWRPGRWAARRVVPGAAGPTYTRPLPQARREVGAAATERGRTLGPRGSSFTATSSLHAKTRAAAIAPCLFGRVRDKKIATAARATSTTSGKGNVDHTPGAAALVGPLHALPSLPLPVTRDSPSHRLAVSQPRGFVPLRVWRPHPSRRSRARWQTPKLPEPICFSCARGRAVRGPAFRHRTRGRTPTDRRTAHCGERPAARARQKQVRVGRVTALFAPGG